MENLGSDQDELYYTAKNFKKLKFSNKAYIDNTQREKETNQKDIENLKKEYEKLRNDVAMLKKTSLYIPGRAKSAANTEYTFYRLKYDQARCEKTKSKDEWKKYTEKYNELKDEAKIISDDNNPYVRRIKLLENKLDKAMIKYNEAMSIKRIYEQILTRLKEERSGYDNQIAAIQKSLKGKEHDLSEFKLLLQDSKQARKYSEIQLKNNKISNDLFKSHFKKLLNAERENMKEEMMDKNDEKKKKPKKIDILPTLSEDKNTMNNKENNLEENVKELEKADKLIRETTGADDINEICQKFSNLRETKENLKNEEKELNKKCDFLKKRKDEITEDLKNLKYESQDGVTRKEIEDHEKTFEKTSHAYEESRLKMKRAEKLMVDIQSGISTLVLILKEKIFEERLLTDNANTDNNTTVKQEYLELMGKNYDCNEKNLVTVISHMTELFKAVHKKVGDIKDNYNFEEEMNKLDRREENEIENLYIDQQVDSNHNSEYGPEEDIDPEMTNKDKGHRNDFDNALRPYSTQNKRSKLVVNVRDKR